MRDGCDEEVVRRLSAAMATLLAAGLAILGTLLGVVVERLLRLTGRLRCHVSRWDWAFLNMDSQGYTPASPQYKPQGVPAEEATWMEYRLTVDLFNGKEIPTGLRNLAAVIVLEDGKRITSRPLDLATADIVERGRDVNQPVADPLYLLNLPPAVCPKGIGRSIPEGRHPHSIVGEVAQGGVHSGETFPALSRDSRASYVVAEPCAIMGT